MPKSKSKSTKRDDPQALLYVAEVAPGLEHIAQAEIEDKLPHIEHRHTQNGEVTFAYNGPSDQLAQLATVIAIYRIIEFEVPRPKALLGHEHFTRLTTELDRVRQASNDHFADWHMAAAGTHTAVMQRLIAAITLHLGIPHRDNEGDLWLRLRPAKHGRMPVWQALIRMTPRPLATRPWRVVNMPGALNASVAAALLYFTQQHNDDIFLNIGCGSGTMLIERAAQMPAKQMIGVDISPDAIAASHANIAAANLPQIRLIQADSQALPLPNQSVTRIVADLPFGQHIGSHDENLWLYPALLHEASRVAAIGATFTLITHEVKLMDATLPSLPQWHLQSQSMITLTGLHPRIYVLERV
ncbi:methyltransferase domain-containing protein [Phototrophicus methaneseepsis]|uniref:Methyltransferase domain-containing protein n=1 Tax=Phototrophicus methaneseepsis TaxID=2710758 RepID=A0A7S8E6B9_9CHLR|nr:methyltransferase domain-containing protein [Phototrophicus methaneseepsis]QPC81197.1 methyltransferase domain-containing protein [Phototrophicus methaneseepsis]